MNPTGPWQQLLDALRSAWPASRYRDVGVVVGCSGGADSVALLRALCQSVRPTPLHPTQAKGFIVSAHFNHRLRGSQSDRDAEFVAELGQELGVKCEIGVGCGTRDDEQSARLDRREFFQNVLKKHGARYLTLAHNLDDNVETVLYRLMRGTGPAGLTGIDPFRDFSDSGPGSDFVIARPLLQVGRTEIRDALTSIGASWREDASNASSRYRRNWIRNELVPMIRSQFPDAVAAVDRAIDGQRQWAEAIEPQVLRWLSEIPVRTQPLQLRRFDPDRYPQAVTIEALRRCWLRRDWPMVAMNQTHWKQLAALVCGHGPKTLTLPGAIQVSRDTELVTLTRGS